MTPSEIISDGRSPNEVSGDIDGQEPKAPPVLATVTGTVPLDAEAVEQIGLEAAAQEKLGHTGFAVEVAEEPAV
jgi:hypothetical protein